MAVKKKAGSRVTFRAAGKGDWAAIETLFGPHGACGGCWCMYWRVDSKSFSQQKGAGNRKAFRALLSRGEPAGILAYEGESPVAWCAVAPRADYVRLERSRILRPVDDHPVWSIVCFLVARSHRRRGFSVPLIHAAVDYARHRGARIVEGYPVEPRKGEMPDVFAYTGIASCFRKAGFREVARRSPTRPFMRYEIPRGSGAS